MKQFNDDNFLLETKASERLYHEHAARMPFPIVAATSTRRKLQRTSGSTTSSGSLEITTNGVQCRRGLCNFPGNDIERGLLPVSEIDFIGREIVEGIAYRNAKN